MDKSLRKILLLSLVVFLLLINTSKVLAQTSAAETTAVAVPIATAGASLNAVCIPLMVAGGVPCDPGVRYNTYHMLLSSMGIEPGTAQKENIWNSFAMLGLKIMMREFTMSLVNWINSGFQGNPSFIQDPKGFFERGVDRTIGNFIQDSKLSFLCEPFQLNIKLALSLQYSPFQDQIGCRLSDVFDNTKDAYNKFTKGDFINGGGWDSWLSLSTVPQNTKMGAQLAAQTQLRAEIETSNDAIGKELNWGGGLLSMKKCTKTARGPNGDVVNTSTYNGDPSYSVNTKPSRPVGSSQTTTGKPIAAESEYVTTVDEKCDIVTPGSAIQEMMQKSTTLDLDALNMADDINEIIGALANFVISTTINKGYALVSKNELSPNDPSWRNSITQAQSQLYNDVSIGSANPGSYNISNMSNNYSSGIDTNTYGQDNYSNTVQDAELKNKKENMLAYLQAYKTPEQNYYTSYSAIYSNTSSLIGRYTQIYACYDLALNRTTNVLTPSEQNTAQEGIDTASTTINQLRVSQNALLTNLTTSQSNLNSINNISSGVSGAYTSDQVDNEILKFNSIMPYLHQWSQVDINTASSTLNTLNQKHVEASDELSNCQSL